jgi:hypothetical protein
LFVGTKTDEFNKTIKLTCPLSVHPQSKQIKFETLVAASGRDHTEPKDNILCCIPTINLSLSLSLSLLLASDYWSLMSDCNKLVFLPFAQRLAFLLENKEFVHTLALPFTLIKKYLKAKRRIMETLLFHHAKNIIFNKSSQRNPNPSKYYNSVTNLSSFKTQAKISSFKNPHIKIDLLPRGQSPLSYYTL